MPDPTWDFYARQLVGVLSSVGTVFLFLALLAFEWQRREAVRACREVAKEIVARNEAVRAAQERRREERRRLAGIEKGAAARALKSMIKG